MSGKPGPALAKTKQICARLMSGEPGLALAKTNKNLC